MKLLFDSPTKLCKAARPHLTHHFSEESLVNTWFSVSLCFHRNVDLLIQIIQFCSAWLYRCSLRRSPVFSLSSTPDQALQQCIFILLVLCWVCRMCGDSW